MPPETHAESSSNPVDEDERSGGQAGRLDRRRYVASLAAVGSAALAGCTVNSDGIEISFGSSDDDGDGGEPDGADGASGDDTDESTAGGEDDSGESDSGDGDTDDDATPDEPAVASRFRVEDVRLWSMDGTIDAYGTLKIRGVYDGDEYLNPEGEDDWEVLTLDEGDAITVTEGTPASIDTEAVVDFPASAMTDVDEDALGPFLVVRGDFIQRLDGTSNEYLGWDAPRVFLDSDPDVGYGMRDLRFTDTDQHLRLTFAVSPLTD